MVTNVELPLGTGSFGNFLFLEEYNHNNLKNVSAALQVNEPVPYGKKLPNEPVPDGKKMERFGVSLTFQK